MPRVARDVLDVFELMAREADRAAHPDNCPACGSDTEPVLLGQLGNRFHFRCRDCGIPYSREVE